jgi:hypothetical protein
MSGLQSSANLVLCEKNTKFYLREAKRLLENLGLRLNEKKTHVVDTRQQGLIFFSHTLKNKNYWR